MTRFADTVIHGYKSLSAALLLCLVGAVGCGDDPVDEQRTDADAGDTDITLDGDLGDTNDLGEDTTVHHTSDTFNVRPTVEQIYIWLAPVDTIMEVLNAADEVVATAQTDELGSLVFRDLEPADGYTVRIADDPGDFTDGLEVMSIEGSLPDESFYASQILDIGYGYLTTRDGTTLSVFVSLPGPPEEGPYPTLVNYSGYSPSQPGQPLGGVADGFCGIYPILCDAPNFPSGLIAGMMGYAVVGVNVRGTGCSGGAYDYFEPLQLLDGYDVIEIVARQDWVSHHHVGMIGLSYPGITQLFVALTRPPSLAAIAPFSVIADTSSSTLLPGGIYNIGFAIEWIRNVLDSAVPYGYEWVGELVADGDTICEENQWLHSQRLDAISKAYGNPFYTDVAAQVDPTSFVDQIDVPVFLVGQCQDEQTGPHFPALFDRFTSAPVTRFTMTNGIHMDGFAPQILSEWANFLDLYVALEVPEIPAFLRSIVPVFMENVFETGLELPQARFEDYQTWEDALAAYEAEPTLRVIFESGASSEVEVGAPEGTFEAFFDWPIESTVPTRWYFHQDGSMQVTPPGEDGGASSFDHDPEAGHRVTLASGTVDHLQPDWDYRQPREGQALSFITDPLQEDLVMIGFGSVDLWLQSTAPDADLEVSLTEVRPDGDESYVQCGWLRASQRALRDDASELRPIKTHRQEDAQPLVPDEWNDVRIELMPFVHIFRAGSRIRMTIDTPGDSMALWQFELLEYDDGAPTHSVAHDADFPSSMLLPVIPGIEVPTDLPPCHALRGQPCRTYEPFTNRPME